MPRIRSGTIFTFKISDEGKQMLETLAKYHGIDMRDVVEMAVREKARRELPEAEVCDLGSTQQMS